MSSTLSALLHRVPLQWDTVHADPSFKGRESATFGRQFGILREREARSLPPLLSRRRIYGVSPCVVLYGGFSAINFRQIWLTESLKQNVTVNFQLPALSIERLVSRDPRIRNLKLNLSQDKANQLKRNPLPSSTYLHRVSYLHKLLKISKLSKCLDAPADLATFDILIASSLAPRGFFSFLSNIRDRRDILYVVSWRSAFAGGRKVIRGTKLRYHVGS